MEYEKIVTNSLYGEFQKTSEKTHSGRLYPSKYDKLHKENKLQKNDIAKNKKKY
jgi:hypothetical protein